MIFEKIILYSIIITMNFYVYKLIDGVNNYYLYHVSRGESPDMQIEHAEHYGLFFPDNLVNSYFDFIGCDNVEIQACCIW